MLLDPNRVDEAIVPGTEFSLPRPTNKPRRDGQRPIIPAKHFGICRDFTACCDALRNDPLMRELFDATDDRSLFRRFHAGHPKLDVVEKRHHPEAGLVLKELATEAVARETMEVAIRFALAGPADLDKFRLLPDREHKLVSSLVRDIYVELMWNRQRRMQGAIHAKAPATKPPAPPDPRRDSPADSELETLVPEEVAALSSLTKKEQAELVTRLLHEFDHPDQGTWSVFEGQAADSVRPDTTDESIGALWDCCLQTVALARLGVRDARLTQCVRELAADPGPEFARLGRTFLPLLET